MALSLNDVNKEEKRRHKAAAPSIDDNKIQKKVQRNREKRQHLKPWQVSTANHSPQPRTKKDREISLTEAEQASLSAAKIDHGWLFGEDSKKSIEALLNQADEFYYQLQKNSYLLSKLNKSSEWLRSIQVYPKVKIPIPSIFAKKDKQKPAR